MEFSLITSCLNGGVGTVEEIQRLIKKNGKEWVQNLLRFKVIAHESNS